ncbi:hypothetical protein BKG94_04805 [Rodentibacter ratti]|uniref:ATP-dependent nuclease n=1 Tax=Rodentibacter ratti TaxID=1906745 RepID=UPI000987D0D0|nr:AAA family ATPase [Rodentibacter ratti]OOF88903.1 hypothetical protein BKG94_04805 [Rodentibacter ratti]
MNDKCNNFLDKMSITKLKNIHNLELSFNREKNITAIFGPNGCGKSTVLHALACVYQKKKDDPRRPNKGEEYRFSDFFIPTNFGAWDGSKLEITYDSVKNRTYEKKKSRWTRYEDRPRREVYFVGIDICVPKIEREKKKSRITISKDSTDTLKGKIVKDINFVMNRVYDELSDCNDKKYKLAKVGDMYYPSLFMGAGESKIIELVTLLHTAGEGSLVLIDELDLTLHTSALLKMLDIMIKISKDKNLQIIFTSHRDDVLNNIEIKSQIDVKHIFNSPQGKTECFDGTTNKCIAQLTGEYPKSGVIYVEDIVSEEIVKEFLRRNKLVREYDITRFGAVDNAFTIACGLYLSSKELFDKSFFVLDGDKYITKEEKLEQINKKYSGTECGIEEKKEEILSHFMQYESSTGGGIMPPEKFIHSTILKSGDPDSETYQRLSEICGVSDTHQYLPTDYPLHYIVGDFSRVSDIWDRYTKGLNILLEVPPK